MKFRICLLAAGAASLSACGVGHVKEYTPKQRAYEAPSECLDDTAPLEAGQLYTSRSKSLFRDIRAYQICDIVVVRIREQSSATNAADTQLDSSGNLVFGADSAGQLKVSGVAGLDPEELLYLKNTLGVRRSGGTSREGAVEFTISATVKKVLPNGNLFLEGETVVLVNSEENHFYVSGVARPEDVTADNSVLSSRLADAHIEFTGRGIIAEGQEPGWLARIWNWILSPV